MILDEYQKEAFKFNQVKGDMGESQLHSAMGLVEEVGELAGKIKRAVRGDYEKLPDGQFDVDIRNELGDILWYVADFCSTHGFSLEDVAKNNIKKLVDRRERGVIKGSGDDR